jgi:hypothetical protein
MRRIIPALLLLSAVACKPDDTPVWAYDPIYIEPSADGTGVYGFQTWEMFAENWTRRFAERHYVCSVVVELVGTPTAAGDDCVECTAAWSVETALLETDCEATLAEDPGYLALERVAIGAAVSELAEDDPYPSESHGGYVDYGTGLWEVHGWAYPDALDAAAQADDLEWNGQQPFTLWPAYAWDLRG